MVLIRKTFGALLLVLAIYACDNAKQTNPLKAQGEMLIRISEIRIDSNFLEAYKAILKEEAEASVRLEPGVIAIYPMQQKQDQAEIRILEIYANKEAYQSHLKTPHFQKYKTTTLHMVKGLRLVDMDAIDSVTMSSIFKKL